MTQQERLVALIDRSLKQHIDKSCKLAENIVRDLLADGLIVPPCNLGDTVYRPFDGKIREYLVRYMQVRRDGLILVSFCKDSGTMYPFYAEYIGKRFFLTREEAEAALGERSEL